MRCQISNIPHLDLSHLHFLLVAFITDKLIHTKYLEDNFSLLGSWTALEAEERFKEREKGKVRAPKRRRATSSLETKYKAVMLYKSGKTICTVSKEVNYARSTVSEWIQNANKIIEEYEKNDYNPQIKGFYTCRHPELEKILLEWVRDAKTNKVYISPQVIIDKSYDIAEDLGITDFHCNENWVRRFKLRYSLVTKRQSTS